MADYHHSGPVTTESVAPPSGLPSPLFDWATLATVATGRPGRQQPAQVSRFDGSLSGAGGSILLRCGMERATLENDLSRAEAHVANGQKRIAQQHEIIAELDREGHDSVPAKELLATFENTQAMHVANRDRIAGKLATLD